MTENHQEVKADERLARGHFLSRAFRRPELGALAGALMIFAFFSLVAQDSGMFSLEGVFNFLEVSAQLGLLAAAACLLMIGGEFDLSIGSMIAAAGLVIAISTVEFGFPIWLGILMAFMLAVMVGFFNGYLVVKTGLPSFIVTLASMFVLRGLGIGATRLITGRTQIGGLREHVAGDPIAWLFEGKAFKGVFQSLADGGFIEATQSGAPMVEGVPLTLLWWLFVTALATYVLFKTRYGNWIFACGGQSQAARNMGVPVTRVKISLFIFTAVMATLFAVLQVLDSGSADTSRGLLKEFEAIIAVVIGGTLLTGGYGSAIGALLGALIFGTVQMGIFYTGVNTDWFKVFMGLMMLIAVMVNNVVRKKATEAG
jgi:simple sugar transport system permease protein